MEHTIPKLGRGQILNNYSMGFRIQKNQYIPCEELIWRILQNTRVLACVMECVRCSHMARGFLVEWNQTRCSYKSLQTGQDADRTGGTSDILIKREHFIGGFLEDFFRYSNMFFLCDVGPYMIVCLHGGLRRRLQPRTGVCNSGASSFAI